MKFGVCTGAENLHAVERAGYDYVELNLASLTALDADSFSRLADTFDASGIKAESYNCFFPGGFSLVGENFDADRINAYVEKALARAARLGGKVAVLGSGGARNIPEGFDRKVAEEQFISVLRICGDIAKYHGMIIVVEPLNAGETNLINTVADGLDFAARAAHPCVFCLADFFHVLKSGESLDAIKNSGGALRHIHIAGPNRTFYPELEENRALVKEWADALKSCGYCGRISLEGHFAEDFYNDVKNTKLLLDEIFES